MKALIHIGYQKSGSTFLQRKVFMNTNNCNYMGYYPYENIGNDIRIKLTEEEFNINKSHEYLVKSSNINFDAGNYQIKYFKKRISKNKLNIISNERFTDVGFTFPDIESKIKRIKYALNDCEIKILIVVRDQIKVLESMYRERPFDPRCFEIGDFCTFDEWINIDINNNYKIMETLRYENIISCCKSIFGEKSVYVVKFEDIFNKDKLKKKIIEKFGISLKTDITTNDKVNVGLTKSQFFLKGIKRKYFKDMKLPLGLKQSVIDISSKFSSKYSVELSDANKIKVISYYNS